MLKIEELYSKYKVIDIIDTNNDNEDYDANMKLYSELYDKGQVEGFTPVLVEKECEIYPLCDEDVVSQDEMQEIVKGFMIDDINDNCSSVWMGRLLYNCYYDCADEIDYKIRTYNLYPKEESVLDIFNSEIEIEEKNKKFSFKGKEFMLVPTTLCYEILAYISCFHIQIGPDKNTISGIMKMLYEDFGVRMLYINHDEIVLYFPNIIVDKQKFIDLSQILIALNSDVYTCFEDALEKVLGHRIVRLYWRN